MSGDASVGAGRRRASALVRSRGNGESRPSQRRIPSKCSNLRTLLCHACTRPIPRAARKLQMSRTRDVAQDSTGYRGYHRVSQGFERPRRSSPLKLPFLVRLLPFLVRLWPFLAIFVIFTSFLAIREVIFGFHRVSRASQGFTGFHRVSSAELASRHSSAGYVFEASPRWRGESVGWNTYSEG